jgi:putative Mg2+ transporter-C (MgtC) family protein
MPLHPSWQDIGVRLALTLIASALIGYNRGEQGHAAGLRTTILVGLAAAVAMVLANLLLPVGGKASDSFVQLDMMRLPLGILTGVGFIGGGAILKRGDGVSGLTTAATMWLTTVIGLCFGSGQSGLGIAATVLALGALFGLRYVDAVMKREQRARLVIRTAWGASPADLPAQLEPLHCRALLQSEAEEEGRQRMRLAYEISWRRSQAAGPPAHLLDEINRRFELVSFDVLSVNPG